MGTWPRCRQIPDRVKRGDRTKRGLRQRSECLIGECNCRGWSHAIELEEVIHDALVVGLAVGFEGGDVIAAVVIETAVAEADGVTEFMEQGAGDDGGALAHVLVWSCRPEAESDGGVCAAEIGVAGDAGYGSGGDADDGFGQRAVWVAPVGDARGCGNDDGLRVWTRRCVVHAVEVRHSLYAGDSDATRTIVDGSLSAAIGGDNGGCAAGDSSDGCQCRVAAVPRGYGEGVTEKNVVVAVLLPVGEARRAIATGGAGSEVARPDLGELEAVLPADHSGLIGELAGLARAVDAGAFGHCVADLEMECDSCIRERLLHHDKRIVALRVRRGEEILLVGIARAVAEDAAAHVVELNEEVLLAGSCTGQTDPVSGLHVVVAGLSAMEISRGRAGLPGTEDAVIVGVVDLRGENDRAVCSAGIERRVVVVGLAERSRYWRCCSSRWSRRTGS